METCAAFASAQGGRIYISVRDDGTVVEVQIGKGTLEGLANDIAQNTVPKLVPAITTVLETGQTVIVVEVPENPTQPVSAYGRAYRRSGRTNQVLSLDEAAEMYLQGRGRTWDYTVVPERVSHESIPRNKLVADAFFLIGYVEQFGTGTQRMISQLQQAGLPEPEFESREHFFRVVFRKKGRVEERFAGMGLNDRQLRALRQATDKGRVTLADYTQLVDMPHRTLQRDLQELVSKGLLVKRGTARATWYEVKK